MDIYINTRGTYLHQKNGEFLLESEGKKTLISPLKVRSIVAAESVLITTDVIKLALEHNIDIVILDHFGNPCGRFWHSRFGSTANIRRRQLEIAATEEGVSIAKEWIINKLESSIKHLKELEYKRHSKIDMIENEVKEIKGYIKKLNELTEGTAGELRTTIMAYEGNAARHYYKIISTLLPKPFQFKGRSFRPAKDEFNSLLNYSFGILYSRVEKACIIAGLDPFTGILHTDNYNKKSFVFDVIENYRYLSWSTIFSLFSQKKVNKSYFHTANDSYSLNKEGKRLVQEEFGKKLEKKVLYKRRKISNLDRIQQDCHNIAKRLITGNNEEENDKCD